MAASSAPPVLDDEVAIRYRCTASGIDIGFAADAAPVELDVPPALFALPHARLADVLTESLNAGAAFCQQKLAADTDLPAVDEEFMAAPSAEDGLRRLSIIADLFTDAHHTLVSAQSTGVDQDRLVEATANAAGTITGLRFSPQLAANGPKVAAQAIAAACAAAVHAANSGRAAVIEKALGAVLNTSLTGDRHDTDRYL